MSFLQPVSPHALHALSVLSGDLMVAANKGVQAGWLVPLSAGLCYMGKQGSFMPLSSITRVRSTRLVTVRWWLTRAKSCADLVPFWALQRLSFLEMSALGEHGVAHICRLKRSKALRQHPCRVGPNRVLGQLFASLQVSFHRTGGSSATFDITIKMAAAAAGGAGKALELGQIDAAELPKLQTYCMNQRIRVSGEGLYCVPVLMQLGSRGDAREAVWEQLDALGAVGRHKQCPAGWQ